MDPHLYRLQNSNCRPIASPMPEREWSGYGRLFLSSPRSPNGLPEAGNPRTVRSSLRPSGDRNPMRSDSRARLRRLRRVSALSAPNNFLPSSAVSQFPTRTPSLRTPFTRRMPAARSGLRSPQSDASYASRRIAASLRLIVDGAYGCCSRAIRYRVTTVLLKASRGFMTTTKRF